MKTQFITAAVRAMMTGASAVILTLSANAAKKPYENTDGFGVACAAIEAPQSPVSIRVRQAGIRVVCLRSAGLPDATGVSQVFDELQGC